MLTESRVPGFPATRWSVVEAAAGQGQTARAALDELCRIYWPPLYAFARRKGFSQEDAEDETQSFLVRVSSGDLLMDAAPDRGRLRTFLLAAFQHDLLDTARRRSRVKRGGRVQFVAIDSAAAEARAAQASGDSAEAAYDRAFALTCLERAAHLLAEEYAGRGKAELFGILRPFLDPGAEPDHAAAAAAAGCNGNALRQAVFRLRQRFGVLLRQVVADTLAQPTDEIINDEMAALRAALAR